MKNDTTYATATEVSEALCVAQDLKAQLNQECVLLSFTKVEASFV